MLPAGRIAKRKAICSGYVCLSCRLQSNRVQGVDAIAIGTEPDQIHSPNIRKLKPEGTRFEAALGKSARVAAGERISQPERVGQLESWKGSSFALAADGDGRRVGFTANEAELDELELECKRESECEIQPQEAELNQKSAARLLNETNRDRKRATTLLHERNRKAREQRKIAIPLLHEQNREAKRSRILQNRLRENANAAKIYSEHAQNDDGEVIREFQLYANANDPKPEPKRPPPLTYFESRDTPAGTDHYYEPREPMARGLRKFQSRKSKSEAFDDLLDEHLDLSENRPSNLEGEMEQKVILGFGDLAMDGNEFHEMRQDRYNVGNQNLSRGQGARDAGVQSTTHYESSAGYEYRPFFPQAETDVSFDWFERSVDVHLASRTETKVPGQASAFSHPRESKTFYAGENRRPNAIGAGTPFKPFFAGTQETRTNARFLHSSARTRQQAAATAERATDLTPPPTAFDHGIQKNIPIREQLRQWQELHGHKEDPADQLIFDADANSTGPVNNFTRLPEADSSFRSQDVEEEEEREAFQELMRSAAAAEDADGGIMDTRFLNVGDLVELEYPRSERESIIAVFVRRLGYESQFYTMNGRWVHMPERLVQYSIPGWVSPDLVKPLLPYMPDPQDLKETEQLSEQAYVTDLSIPRHISAGLVKRMTQFHMESLEIYRKHAGRLDSAHAILAHETDLRYGSLIAAATTLLHMKPSELPVTALFTVRKALARAGFAFNIDRRSHRLTGYLQIRSKEQVKMVETVRGWMREWQDDVAVRASLEGEGGEAALRQHKTPRQAQYVHDFLEKAKKIILRSRENRDLTEYGTVGPSKKKFPITPASDCVKVTVDTQFTWEDTELVRFMEAWACSSMFLGLPRIEALPPLLLQATGLYGDVAKYMACGNVFLQELGTIMPYENRVRFDQHLLLPSSQHSKPLQQLMSTLMQMKDKHNFSDSMKDLRHDWKDMPVYCIDKAGAHEIDDGISIERTGENVWWVHVHIANPTAFFERDHALAKMARHMGESIYMPERTYMMLPRWATSGHFSLRKDRPCLTFSAKLDAEGRTLEKKIQAGIVRNVFSLTPDDIRPILGKQKEKTSETILTVGGELPPPKAKKSAPAALTANQKEELEILRQLAQKRSEIRRAAGGMFMNQAANDITVWQNWNGAGLNWDHPYRHGSRKVEGDPIIQLRTQGLRNWFTPIEETVDVMVREMMLLACEVAGSWCAERQIPAIFRGSKKRPDTPDRETFISEILQPAMKDRRSGDYPMHLGVQYLSTHGTVGTSTKPLRHSVMGMDTYGKVTSPLRRYGDMILHWQIQAALRQEARTGKSLVTQGAKADLSFLPFSESVLETIMVGLGPREKIVRRATIYADETWTAQLLFRAFHYNEAELPFWTPAFPTKPDGSTKPLPTCYIYTRQYTHPTMVNALLVELNHACQILRPDHHGLEEARTGDLWECELDYVDVYGRLVVAKPVRLAERAEYGAEPLRGMIGRASS